MANEPIPTEILECDLSEEKLALEQLEKSQILLREAFNETKDRDFKAAFDDNIIVIAKKRSRIAYLEEEIMKIKEAIAERSALGLMDDMDEDVEIVQKLIGLQPESVIADDLLTRANLSTKQPEVAENVNINARAQSREGESSPSSVEDVNMADAIESDSDRTFLNKGEDAAGLKDVPETILKGSTLSVAHGLLEVPRSTAANAEDEAVMAEATAMGEHKVLEKEVHTASLEDRVCGAETSALGQSVEEGLWL